MYFNHALSRQDETIAAISTPPGEGGIAVIRISGSHAIGIAKSVSNLPFNNIESHKAYYGKILESHQVIDSVLFLVMLEGRSYTGEETVEVHCHGGSLITKKVLDLIIQAGARPAAPGEFTFRAYMNNKIDLAQAEAVQEVISAKNEYALQASELHLEGGLSKRVKSLQKKLLDLVAIFEAWVDFPEEGLEYMTLEQMKKELSEIIDNVNQLSSSYHEGKTVREGVSLCLVGCPNVGKSSLMNALLDSDRAIVTDIAGTTRDTLEEHLTINGLNFKLLDTAGVRETDELVESEGIKRTFKALKKAELVLWVVDQSRGIQEHDQLILKEIAVDKTILVWNKSDLPSDKEKLSPSRGLRQVNLSAKYGEGLEVLKEHINSIIWKEGKLPEQDQILVTQSRHKEALDRSSELLLKSLNALSDEVSAEFIAYDSKQALKELGSIIGINVSEEVLGAIFSKFCIGK